jgi:hypothetical protein
MEVDEARQILDAVYLPPVSQGDVYRCALHRPRAIGIVDGFFELVPAVWHKEILWAMKEGVAVFGAASMGALRAAELEPFGMVGVGAVFEAFRDGVLEDDDEVAVRHAPPDMGYLAGSDAMVNIRATLHRAETETVLHASTRRRLECIAKGLYYPDRSYRRVLALARETGLATEELDALAAWLSANRVDQKREDARAMLDAMRAWLETDSPRTSVDFVFEHTSFWDQVMRGEQGES